MARLTGFPACMKKELKGKGVRKVKRKKTSAQVRFGAAARRCAKLAKAEARAKKRGAGKRTTKRGSRR